MMPSRKRKKHSHISFFLRVFVVIFSFSFLLYSYIHHHNALTQLRLAIPEQKRKVMALKEKNNELQCLIYEKENPHHLLRLFENPQYRHLEYPCKEEIIYIKEAS